MTVSIAELCENYRDDNEGGVYGYDNGVHKLTLRPQYQREFVYNDKQKIAVIDSVYNYFPLGLMYWSVVGEGRYECLDGQQRAISIAQYVHGEFSVKIDGHDKFFHNLTDTQKQRILDYTLDINVCNGTDEEKLKWFSRINIAGEVLTKQELLNATYSGPWLSDAKRYFSKRNCAASNKSDGYLKGNPIRQELLETALKWVAYKEGLADGQQYMAVHQHDEDANALWVNFQTIINWTQTLFPTKRKGITDTQDWGLLFKEYGSNLYNTATLEEEVSKLVKDEEVEKKSGIIQYLLSSRAKSCEKYLSLRSFPESMKLAAYEKQGRKCPCCVAEGNNMQYGYSEMQRDHIIPWSKGSKTEKENLQMLCKKHNREKGNN